MLNRFKGQGALEYLLLIGGAVVVAAVVIVLLLGTGSSGNTQSESAAMGKTCSIIAASVAKTGTPKCDDLEAGTDQYYYIWNAKTSSCWTCGGTYPNCTATKVNKVQSTCCESGSSCQDGLTVSGNDPVSYYLLK
ncbi:MAG: class III signal peptide-containing protein [Candidatus Diapherotrites archaeon]